VAEELLEDRVKKLEKSVELLAEVPGQLTRLDQRVERLEARTERIEGRVTNVELQVLQLRTDMRAGFSAASRELGDTRSSLLEVIDSSSRATQKLYDEGRKETRELLTDLRKDVVQTLGTQMRVLHEDLVERIKVLGKA
jgi:F0F1-type ATP synthase membrane subunit b/b'